MFASVKWELWSSNISVIHRPFQRKRFSEFFHSPTPRDSNSTNLISPLFLRVSCQYYNIVIVSVICIANIHEIMLCINLLNIFYNVNGYVTFLEVGKREGKIKG